MNPHRPFLAVFVLASALALAVACSSATGPKPPAGQGQLAISLVDAPNPAVDEIHVNISRVTAHSTSAGWVTVSTFDPPLGVDLLKLTSAAAPLGFANLPPGTVTQVRLLVAADGNYVLTGGKQGATRRRWNSSPPAALRHARRAAPHSPARRRTLT